ncbi:MAG: hypothetical protein ACE5NM_10245, partial [Sedimentisphaerales bacterium]
TYPRVGYVKFPGRADKKSLIVWDIAVPLVVVGLIICVGIWVRPLLPLCLGIFLAGARITGYVRDYIFVGLFLASGLVGLILVLLGYDPFVVTAYQFWGLSTILIPVGLVQLVRFLRKYPEPIKEAKNDNV